jgi:hypothetical protein
MGRRTDARSNSTAFGETTAAASSANGLEK